MNYIKLTAEKDNLRKQYAAANPFPHIVIDNFLNNEAADIALQEFPPIESDEWINYTHYNENKFGKNDFENFTPGIKNLINELNSDRFVKFLSHLTGFDNLIADKTMEGGGLHQASRGGFLNMHADFTVHPHHYHWQRRVNLLIYLNKEWKDSYGGHLELWDRRMKNCAQSIAPVFNRAVIFSTDETSYHGHPNPMKCPEGVTRKSIALYYFTEEKSVKIRSTEYKAQPHDSNNKRILIYLDKIILRLYDRLKRLFGINDDLASKALHFITSLLRRK